MTPAVRQVSLNLPRGATLGIVGNSVRASRHWRAASSPDLQLVGRVEQGLAAEVFGNPKHPYTQALLNSIPGGEFAREHVTAV